MLAISVFLEALDQESPDILDGVVIPVLAAIRANQDTAASLEYLEQMEL